MDAVAFFTPATGDVSSGSSVSFLLTLSTAMCGTSVSGTPEVVQAVCRQKPERIRWVEAKSHPSSESRVRFERRLDCAALEDREPRHRLYGHQRLHRAHQPPNAGTEPATAGDAREAV